MTILEAIAKVDSDKPNCMTQDQKVYWLSLLDGRIKKEIIDTHEGGEKVIFGGYDENTSLDTVLLVPFPYDDIYIRWLESCIDYAIGEYNKYNNSATRYNEALAVYSRYYNKLHMPLSTVKRFIF